MVKRNLFANASETATPLAWPAFFANENISPAHEGTKLRRVLLAPYGDWPNVRGLQRFTRDDAQNIVNEFNSTVKRVLNPSSWLGLPWYEGHPDHPDFRGKAGHSRSTAVGRIKGLEAGNDGLYADVKFNEDGEKLIVNESYHGHSVNWYLREDKNSDRSRKAYRPFSLKSVGFTNEPNIPVPAVTTANAEADATTTLPAEFLAANALRYQHMAKLRANGYLAANAGTSAGVKKGWERRRGHSVYQDEKLYAHATPEEREAAGVKPEDVKSVWHTIPTGYTATIWEQQGDGPRQPEMSKKFKLHEKEAAHKWATKHAPLHIDHAFANSAANARAGLEVGRLLGFVSSLKVAHWNASTALNDHKALGELYEAVEGLVDDFVETYLGKFKGQVSATTLPVEATQDYGALIRTGAEIVAALRGSLETGADDDLLNILADIDGALNKSRYLLKANEKPLEEAANAGTSAGVKKSWEKRRHGSLVAKDAESKASKNRFGGFVTDHTHSDQDSEASGKEAIEHFKKSGYSQHSQRKKGGSVETKLYHAKSGRTAIVTHSHPSNQSGVHHVQVAVHNADLRANEKPLDVSAVDRYRKLAQMRS